jgi:hypothetical protein
LTSQPVLLAVPGGQSSTGYERERYRDFTTSLGGPIARDRLWFFGSYQYLRDYDSQPGTEPNLPRKYEQDKIFGKLTWKLKPGLQLVNSFHDEFWVSPQTPTLVTPFVATQRLSASVPTMTFGQLTHALSAATLWEARAGRFVYSRDDDPSSGDRTTANRFDRRTGVSSGNVPLFGALTLIRTTAKATLTHYQRGWLGLDHEWKVGTSVEKGEHFQPQVIPGGTRYVDDNGQPFQAISSPPAKVGGEFITAAAFASDSVRIGDRLTINAGLRFDHSRAISQDIKGVDAEGHDTSETINGLGTLYTWNVFSPRLGVTAVLPGDGRTMLRASYGRFNQGVLTGEISPIHPGAAPVTTTAFDAATGGYTTLVSVVNPKVNLLIDPKTRTPRTDEYSIGIDREIRPRLAVAVGYIGKTGSHFIGWTDIAGQYQEQTRTLPNQQTLPVFVLTSPASGRRFLLTNPNGYSLRYNGLVTVVEKRHANGWQALGSYTYSRASGPSGHEWSNRGGCAGEHRRTKRDIRARSEQPDQRVWPAGKRSAAHVPVDGQRRGAANRLHRRRQLPALHRQAVGGDDPGHAAARRSTHPARATRIPSPGFPVVARLACFESVAEARRNADRGSRRRSQRAQREGRRKHRDRQSFQSEFRAAHVVRGSTPGDDRREIESGPVGFVRPLHARHLSTSKKGPWDQGKTFDRIRRSGVQKTTPSS